MPRTLFSWAFRKSQNILTCLWSEDAWSLHPWAETDRILPYICSYVEAQDICRVRTTCIGPLCFMFAWIEET